jgi:hypothetical protein
VDHLKELQAHFEKRETAYEEVKAAAAEAQRDLTVHEKEEAGLEERKKYSSTQAKKLRKALQDDRKGKKDAERAIEENAGKIKKEKASVRALEGELGREEAALEEITEGLKGKTQVFHDQIEAKQKELQPWTTKIDRKEADRAVAQGELEGLFKKTESAEVASQEADEQLQQLQTARAVKVGVDGIHVLGHGLIWWDRTRICSMWRRSVRTSWTSCRPSRPSCRASRPVSRSSVKQLRPRGSVSTRRGPRRWLRRPKTASWTRSPTSSIPAGSRASMYGCPITMFSPSAHTLHIGSTG